MSVFIYLAPPLTALGLHFFVRGRAPRRAPVARRAARLRRARAGVRRGLLGGAQHLARRPVRLVAAMLWAATTVLIRATRPRPRERRPRPCSTSLAVSAPSLPLASRAAGRERRHGGDAAGAGEPRLPGRDRRVRELPRLVLAAHALPARRRSACSRSSRRCSACCSGVVFLSEPLSAHFAAAALLVAAGIALVNLGAERASAASSSAMSRRPCSESAISALRSLRCGALLRDLRFVVLPEAPQDALHFVLGIAEHAEDAAGGVERRAEHLAHCGDAHLGVFIRVGAAARAHHELQARESAGARASPVLHRRRRHRRWRRTAASRARAPADSSRSMRVASP